MDPLCTNQDQHYFADFYLIGNYRREAFARRYTLDVAKNMIIAEFLAQTPCEAARITGSTTGATIVNEDAPIALSFVIQRRRCKIIQPTISLQR